MNRKGYSTTIEHGPRINTNGSLTEKQLRRRQHMARLNAIHGTSGLTLREVARACDVDHSYVHCILNGERRPKRDVIIALGFAYRLDRLEVDELLILAESTGA